MRALIGQRALVCAALAALVSGCSSGDATDGAAPAAGGAAAVGGDGAAAGAGTGAANGAGRAGAAGSTAAAGTTAGGGGAGGSAGQASACPASHDRCGCAQTACSSAEACIEGMCVQPITRSLIAAAAAGDAFYWLERAGSSLSLYRILDAAESSEALGTSVHMYEAVGPMLLDDEYAYVAALDDAGSYVLRAPLTGGPLEVIANQPLEIASNSEPGIGLDANHLYWVGERGIYRAPRAGGAPELWIRHTCISDLLVQAGTAFFSCVYDRNIRAVATDAAPISDISSVVPMTLAFHAGPLRLQAGMLYFRSGSGEIGRQSVGSAGVEKLNLLGSGEVRDFDVVDGAVIAAVVNGAADTSSLLRLAGFKGPPAVLATGDDEQVRRVYASTEAWTYWQGSGVFRVPR